MQRNYDFQIKGSEAMFWLGMDKLNSLRGTIDNNLIGREPAHVREDIRAGKIIYKDQLMIACIRTHVDPAWSECRSQSILMNIARHMEVTIMQAGKEDQEQ